MTITFSCPEQSVSDHTALIYNRVGGHYASIQRRIVGATLTASVDGVEVFSTAAPFAHYAPQALYTVPLHEVLSGRHGHQKR